MDLADVRSVVAVFEGSLQGRRDRRPKQRSSARLLPCLSAAPVAAASPSSWALEATLGACIFLVSPRSSSFVVRSHQPGAHEACFQIEHKKGTIVGDQTGGSPG